MDLGRAIDLAEVAVGEAARAGVAEAGRALDRGRTGDRAIERLPTDGVRYEVGVVAHVDLRGVAVSSCGNWLTMKSCAYQSLQASPIAADCAVLSAPTPPASVTSRFESPCVYSW